VFTGIVEAVGRVRSVRRTGPGATLTVEAPFAASLRRGESVCVSGVCLTVTAVEGSRFRADAVARTLEMTTLGGLRAGSRVNLERAVRAGDRMGGHLVTGHADGTGVVRSVRAVGRGRDLVIELPAGLAAQVVERGSVALDGTSLTVAAVDGRRVTVSLIPETLAATVAGAYRPGSRVNVETDALANARGARGEGGQTGMPEARGVTMEQLREQGFVKER
jgi:riboflavin synthase alpha subunit